LGVYWQYNPVYNELQFSPFHLNEVTIDAYLNQIIRYKPSYFHGYPSSIDYLAKYILNRGLQGQIQNIKAVFLVSEGFTYEQRQRIEEAFSSRVFSFYGHSERVVMAGECEINTTYHHFPDYGVLELIDEDGCNRNNEGEHGEIVGTGLLNRSLPLIRYRTGDYATRCNPSCECGRQWDRFTNVQGRWNQEVVIGNNGAKISIAALNMHGAIFDNVVRYQYYQDQIGHCDLRIMVNSNFTDTDKNSIEQAFKSKIMGQLSLQVKIVNEIPLTVRGKVKLLISELSCTL
jgi:phenylacetate-CoA ligase